MTVFDFRLRIGSVLFSYSQELNTEIAHEELSSGNKGKKNIVDLFIALVLENDKKISGYLGARVIVFLFLSTILKRHALC